MIITKCPACSKEIKAPESFLGKKVRCKSEGCEHIFVVAQVPPVAEPPVFGTPVIPDSPREVSPLENLDLALESSLPTRPIYPTTPRTDGRYPNLQKYLRWARLVATGQLLMIIVISCSILLVSLVDPISHNLAIQDAILPFLARAAVSLLIGIAGYLIYVFTMAGVEFVYVIIDIESNTRVNQSRVTEG